MEMLTNALWMVTGEEWETADLLPLLQVGAPESYGSIAPEPENTFALTFDKKSWDMLFEKTNRLLRSLEDSIENFRKLMVLESTTNYSLTKKRHAIEENFILSDSMLVQLKSLLAIESDTIEVEQRCQRLEKLCSVSHSVRGQFLAVQRANESFKKKKKEKLLFTHDQSELLQEQQDRILQQDEIIAGVIMPSIEQLKLNSYQLRTELQSQNGILKNLNYTAENVENKMKCGTEDIKNYATNRNGPEGCCCRYLGWIVIFILLVVIMLLLATNWACHIFNTRRC